MITIYNNSNNNNNNDNNNNNNINNNNNNNTNLPELYMQTQKIGKPRSQWQYMTFSKQQQQNKTTTTTKNSLVRTTLNQSDVPFNWMRSSKYYKKKKNLK